MSKQRTPDFLSMPHDARDPSPWRALYLDQSTPIDEAVKHAWLVDSSSASRQYLLPFIRPFARSLIILFQVLKVLMPRRLAFSRALHRLLAWGMENFIRPEANWLILRGFLVDGKPDAASAMFRSGLKVYPLSRKASPPGMEFRNGSRQFFNTIHANNFDFYEELHTVIEREPVSTFDPELRGTFAAKSDEFAGILKMGRTQLQDAVPMTLGQEFHVFATTLGEDEDRIREVLPLLRKKVSLVNAQYRGGSSALPELLAARRDLLSGEIASNNAEKALADAWAAIRYLIPQDVK